MNKKLNICSMQDQLNFFIKISNNCITGNVFKFTSIKNLENICKQLLKKNQKNNNDIIFKKK